MSVEDTAAIAAAARLREAFERLALSLARPQVDGLLESEAAIERALANVPSLAGVSPAGRQLVQLELERARASLLRCRRLGAALGEFVRLTLDAQGHNTGYGPRGAAPVYAGVTLNTRV